MRSSLFPALNPLSVSQVSMYAASINSTTGAIATYARKMAQNGKPDIEITLDNHSEGKVYTTFDALSGKVEITAPHNARFDEVQITLQGSVKTFVENLSPTSARTRTTAVHNFLRLTMPIRESEYPHPRIAEAGITYTFPYNFVIPDQLLPRSCTHECRADHVHQAHLQLPPSMGDREVSMKHDMAPDMSKVQYSINAKVVRNREQDGREVVLVEGRRKIHVVPAQSDQPPMSIGADDGDYVLSKTKPLKKGMFSGKLGKITVSAAQTGALMLPSPSSSSDTPATTMATINLRFDPHDPSCEPPRLGGLNTKIKISTFFAVRAEKTLPTRSSMVSQFETTRGVYETSINLSSRCVESVAWTKRTANLKRKNSASSSSSSEFSDTVITPEPSGTYYAATVLVPITLPSHKTWVPTFHSCISSRIYQLDLSLKIHTPGTGVPASTVSLHLPVQIGATGNQTHRASLTAAEAAAELADADEYLRPRVIEVPIDGLIGNSDLARVTSDLPPSYEDFASQPRQVVDPGRC